MFADPHHLIEQFDLQSGARVADFGAGGGALALVAARAVGDAGKVYAVDVQKELLERLKNEARAARVHNLEVLWGDVERQGGTHLKDGAVDAVILSNILFQLEDRTGAAKEAKRVLKPGGKLLAVDWSGSFGRPPSPMASARRGMGPDPTHVVTEQVARTLFEQNGFQLVKTISAGNHHYGLVFRKT